MDWPYHLYRRQHLRDVQPVLLAMHPLCMYLIRVQKLFFMLKYALGQRPLELTKLARECALLHCHR